MPTLTVSVDLSDDAYRKAVLMSPGEQTRVASIALTAASTAPEDESAAFYAQLTDAEKAQRCRIVEAGSTAGDAGRVVDGDTLFARVCARHHAAEQ